MLPSAWNRVFTAELKSHGASCMRTLRGCNVETRLAPGKLSRFSTQAPRSLPALQKQTERVWSRTSLLGGIGSKHRSFDPRFFQTNAATLEDAAEAGPRESSELPILSPPSVSIWLLSSAAVVFTIVVVGGVTRLTESGLSITEWKPVTGIIPPLTKAQWEEEFEKYKRTPEFKLLNHQMNVEEFKSIFFWEWGHRVLGRLAGIGFVVPLAYFAVRRRLTASLPKQLAGMALLFAGQGFMGWYMVKSGLEDSLMETPGAVPRVSHYRLASHLCLAFLLYAGMFVGGISTLMDWRFAHKGVWSGISGGDAAWRNVLTNPIVRKFLSRSRLLCGLVFITAMSGALVAGLDAGLLYNEFPLMGGRLMPPTDELFTPVYAKKADGSDLWWRNILENPTTVQFDHRVLATISYCGITALWASARNPAVRAALPPLTRSLLTGAFAMANVQVLLGITTLLYLVPIPIAAGHQAGSVALFTMMLHILVSLRKPGAAARVWQQAFRSRASAAAAAASRKA